MKREIGMKNNDYLKLRGFSPKSAVLLQVFRLGPKDVSKAFRKYNYGYTEKGKLRYHELQKQKILVLLLQDKKTGRVFTTSRKDNPENRSRFLKSAGKAFRIFRD